MGNPNLITYPKTAAGSGSSHGQGNDEGVGEEVDEEEEAVNQQAVGFGLVVDVKVNVNGSWGFGTLEDEGIECFFVGHGLGPPPW